MVGQGDSIIIEWINNNQKHFGIIDCNLFQNSNPILNHLEQYSIKEIDFIILSHFHYDHFSGMADIFEYCIENNIIVKSFYHTIITELGQVYNRIFISQKLQRGVKRFVDTYENFDRFVKDKIHVT